MAEKKTRQTTASVDDFIDALDNQRRQEDSRVLVKLMQSVSGEPARMWGPSIIGFGDVHTRAHLYRAILEGLVYGLRAGAEQIERRTGRKIRRLVVGGGGSQSDSAMQITADIFGLAAERPEVYETSALGAAINLAVGLGLHPDYAAAVRAMTRVGRRFVPEPGAQAIYLRLYREVYRDLYPRLQPLYRRIRDITGYPV